MTRHVLLALALSLPLTALAAPPRETQSDLRGLRAELEAEARDFAARGILPLSVERELGGFDELTPYLLASPNQEDAGSCLYMSLTGVAEWWLARLHPELPRTPNGPLDLSERYLMNLDVPLANWKTDTILAFNKAGRRSVLNSAYPFTKGWYLDTEDDLQPATATTPGAEYGVYLNWFDDRKTISGGWMELPTFRRTVIFADPDGDQWGIGVAPKDIVERVKRSLTTEKAPVQVIYNHNGYWHSVFVLGFNDELDNGDCAYTERYRERSGERIVEAEKELSEARNAAERKAAEARLKRARKARDRIEQTYAKGGGCTSSKGVFYIRDSIYPDPEGPLYDYDPSNSGPAPDEAPYTRKVVTKEYDWLRYFANHVVSISVQ